MTRLSDIALLKYLGIRHGVDIELLRGTIEASLVRAERAAEQMGGGDYSVRVQGVTFIVRDGVVTTTHPKLSGGSRFHALAPRD